MSDSILTTLHEEHRYVEILMTDITNTSDIDMKKKLYSELKIELTLHMEGEEQTLYTHLIEDVYEEEAEEVANQAMSEHETIKDLLRKLDRTSIESNDWNTLFGALRESVQGHIEAEESSLFAEAKEDFSKNELIEFGDEFEDAKHHIHV